MRNIELRVIAFASAALAIGVATGLAVAPAVTAGEIRPALCLVLGFAGLLAAQIVTLQLWRRLERAEHDRIVVSRERREAAQTGRFRPVE